MRNPPLNENGYMRVPELGFFLSSFFNKKSGDVCLIDEYFFTPTLY